jgi:peptide/nickel transport system substrate-binding protein
MSVGLPPKDYAELAKEGKVQVIGVPVQNDLVFVDMNVKIAPFDNQKVREAVSYAIPYKEIIESALYDRAKPMFDGDPSKPYPEGVWPVPIRHGQDLDKAKQLLTEAGFPNGFKTTLSFDLSEATVREPTAILIQEALKKIGVDIELEKVPGSNWFAQMASKTMPMVIAEFYGWLDYPDYFFFWTFDGKNNSVFDTCNYVNPDLDKLIDTARFTRDLTVYKETLGKDGRYRDDRTAAHSALHALRRLRDAEGRARLRILVPHPPRLPQVVQGLRARESALGGAPSNNSDREQRA